MTNKQSFSFTLSGVFFVLLLSLGEVHTGFAAAGPVRAAKMVAPATGWALARGRLLWTSSNGKEWTDITPPSPGASAHLASIFFLNSTLGWVFFAAGEEDPVFYLASTTDGGANWSVASVNFPPMPKHEAHLLGGGRVTFADPAHGWINVTEEGGSAFAPGIIAATADGGRTWGWTPSNPGIAGSLVAVTPDELWLAGGPDNSYLYVSFDAGRTWQEVKLPAPKEIAPATHATYDDPTFLNSRRGFEPVTFAGPGFRGAAVLFATIDGGRTWHPDRLLTNLTDVSGSDIVPSAIADSTWIVRGNNGGSNALRLAPGTVMAAGKTRLTTGGGWGKLSFTTASEGWLITQKGRLETVSARASSASVDITPPPVSPRDAASQKAKSTSKLIPPVDKFDYQHGAHTQSGDPNKTEGGRWNEVSRSLHLAEPAGGVRSASDSSSVLSTSQHIGFDICTVENPATFMSAWWANSPYFEVGIYLPGAASIPCNVSNLNSDWITEVSSQGWGLIPIWSGLQAPCSGKAHKLDWNPSVARSQGQSEALSALGSVMSLSLTVGDSLNGYLPVVIYDDLEEYSPDDFDETNTYRCGDAVAAFVDGWVSEMHFELQPATGTYANLAAVLDWVGNPTYISNLPDDIWLTGANNNVTVWGLHGSGLALSDDLWAGHSRMHQYHLDDKYLGYESWGGFDEIVDRDIIDAMTVVGSGGTKTYSFTTESVSYPGASYTWPMAINSAVQVDSGHWADYNEGLPVGTIIGYAGDPALTSFFDVGDLFLAIGCSDASEGPFVYGLNDPTFSNDGYIVGVYWVNDSSGSVQHAFRYDIAAGACTTIDHSGAYAISPSTVNDAGWVTGTYSDSDGYTHGFLYKPDNSFSSFDYPGGFWTQALGLDGFGRIVGDYCPDVDCNNPTAGFIDDAESGDPNTPSNFCNFGAIPRPVALRRTTRRAAPTARSSAGSTTTARYSAMPRTEVPTTRSSSTTTATRVMSRSEGLVFGPPV